MFDLFGEESESTVAEMNQKFETYGVNIKSSPSSSAQTRIFIGNLNLQTSD